MIELFLSFLIGLYGIATSKEYYKILISVQISSISAISLITFLNPNLEMLSICLFGIESCSFVFLAGLLFLMKRMGVKP